MPSQAGLFSAALTPFVVDSKQKLQTNPTDQMVYYLQQHSTILSQISQQIASIAPQVSIPTTPPPLFPSFIPSTSDILVNAFWFMALTFSLSAALLAILVQQWVRDYMHVFQRYSDLQKKARMRQYLYEGSEGWYMPIAAEAVPGLLHVSLFLFFVGLADSTLNINTTIGLSTTIPIGICGLLYIFTTFAPAIYPQSPYQTSFSGLIWYAFQKLRDRRFRDRDGDLIHLKPVSTNMVQGQLQLSMEKTEERNGRDKRAIIWLLGNLTEDAEIESFVTKMPGALEAWTELSKEEIEPRMMIPVAAEPSSHSRMIRNVLGLISCRAKTLPVIRSFANQIEHRRISHSANAHLSIVDTSIHENTTIHDFCWRVGHFLNTCKNGAVPASDLPARQKRARVCVEAMASLVSFANVEAGCFGDILQVLGDIGSSENIYNKSLAKEDKSLTEEDEAFVVRWTCLSIMTLRSALNAWKGSDFPPNDRYCDALLEERRAREDDETVEYQWKTARKWDSSPKIPKFVQHCTFHSGLDGIIYKLDRRITDQLSGANFDFPDSGPMPQPKPFLEQARELFRDPARLRLISCRHPPNSFIEFLKHIDAYQDDSPNSEVKKQVIENVIWPKNLLQRRLWALYDIRYGGGLGIAVELFLLSLKQLLLLLACRSVPPHKSYSLLYIGTFQAITSDWRRHRESREWTFDATQNILLDIVASDQGPLRTYDYPDYITEKVWALLGDMLEGQTGPHIDGAVRRLTDLQCEVGGSYRARATALISRLRPSHLQEPSPPTDTE